MSGNGAINYVDHGYDHGHKADECQPKDENCDDIAPESVQHGDEADVDALYADIPYSDSGPPRERENGHRREDHPLHAPEKNYPDEDKGSRREKQNGEHRLSRHTPEDPCGQQGGETSARERSSREVKERSRHRHRDGNFSNDREREGDRDRGRERDRERDRHRDKDRDRERRSERRGGDEADRRHRGDRHSRGSYGREEHRGRGYADKERTRRERDRDGDRDGRHGDRDDRDRDWRGYDDYRHSRREPERRDFGWNDDRRGERREERVEERPRRDDLVLGGYKPRQRSGGAIVPQAMDPFAAVRAKNAAQGLSIKSLEEVERARNEQQAKARQMVLQQQAISTAAAASKTQREVYIGNLQQGKVTEQTLRQLFDEALSTTFPHLLMPGIKPCLSVAMHSEGRYAFVELATPEMATAALQLSGQLNFLGSQMTVGRPSGYIDPAKAAAAAAAASKALQEFTTVDGSVGEVLAPGEAPPASSQPTACLCIDHMISPSVFTDEEEYQELVEDLHDECGKHGAVVDTRIPRPSPDIDPAVAIGQGCYGKVYCLMESIENASAIQRTFHGRVYDGRTLSVSFIHPAHFCMLPVPGQHG